jgi:hypothetical protein
MPKLKINDDEIYVLSPPTNALTPDYHREEEWGHGIL